MNIKRVKQIIAAGLILLLLTGKLIVVPATIYAEDGPTPPAPPEAPTAPSAPSAPTAPEAPTAPTAPSAPSAPTAPEAPTAPSAPSSPDSPTAPEGPSATEQNSLSQPEPTGTNASGNVGDTNVTTGDATNNAGITTTGNNNLATDGCSACAGGTTVSNIDNGVGSVNQGSATTTANNGLSQGNSAVVANDLHQATVTGDNNTSYNVGNSSITTGDANTTGTVLTAVNTNVDGMAVSEFNIVDDHTGDIILDFNASCVQGCGGSGLAVNNLDNGADSFNTASGESTTNNSTTQTNDANIGSNMVLAANSGSNDASFNTGGDSSITTGDANVNANMLTFANNNIAGDVIYGVVNIFGDLVGDIILTEEAMNKACGGSCAGLTSATNAGNGDNSNNIANANNTTNNTIFQSNDATINNTLLIDSNTGNNDSSYNTNGDSKVTTGDASLTANILNIANNNIIGGNWWLVIVNEGGRWIGKIMGAADNANMAGSAGTEFIVDPITGEVTASNTGNAVGSNNSADASSTTTNTTTQTNNAVVNNTLDLSANTGRNSASYNTGGNSDITTGDAKIIANLVNFVNNNITGGGKLVVTVVNVFGSWLGDFVAPGQTKTTIVDGGTLHHDDNSNYESAPVNSGSGGGSSSTVASSTGTKVIAAAGSTTVTTNSKGSGGFVNGTSTGGGTNSLEATVAKSVGQDGSAAVADKKLTINLAWLLFLIPLVGIAIIAKKSFVPVRTLALRGIHLFL